MTKPAGTTRLIAALLAALCLGSGAHAAGQSIDAFEASQQAAWNAHDAIAYTAAFAPDAEIVTSLGWHWTGQAEAARNLGDGFKLVYAQAHLRLAEIRVRELSPELASVSLTWTIAGARAIDGQPQAGEQQGREIQLLQQRGGDWTILAQQDTPIAAVQPSSPGPAPTAGAPPAPAAPAQFPTSPPPVRHCVLARSNGACLISGKPKPAGQ